MANLTIEYHYANGIIESHAATHDVAGLWNGFHADPVQCAHILIRPAAQGNDHVEQHLNALEAFYQSASDMLDTLNEPPRHDDAARTSATASAPVASPERKPAPVAPVAPATQRAFTSELTPDSNHGVSSVVLDRIFDPRLITYSSDNALITDEDGVETETTLDLSVAHPAHENWPFRIMVMNSHDGAEYSWPVLYPAHWTQEQANKRAKEAVSVVKAEEEAAILDGEPELHNYRPRLSEELFQRGFIVPGTDEGPVWD